MSDIEPTEKDDEVTEEEKLFKVELAKTGRAKCKKCKNPIDSGTVRLAKMITNPFGSGKMPAWHHVSCLFEVFKKQRPTTPKIENIDDIEGHEVLTDAQIEEILKYLPDNARLHWQTLKLNVTEKPSPKKPAASVSLSQSVDYSHKDNSLREFRKICLAVMQENSYLQKTNIFRNFFQKGSDGKSFKGDLNLWCRLLLPSAVKTVYNLQSKQLVKVFSRIFQTDHEEMLRHLDDGDVALTISEYFEKSKTIRPASKSVITLRDVDYWLRQLSEMTKEEDQQRHLTEISVKCTANDLQMVIRFIKHDLRINAGPKHVLDALHPDAYRLFKTCRDIDDVMKQIGGKFSEQLKVDVKLLTPVSPMLAEACTSLETTVNKYPDGLYAEIKYDGERVQLHKKGSEFKYFSRSLKPVLPHKVNHFKDYIMKAFPTGDDMILDCEVLMVDTSTGNPLPFGTLGIHKKDQFKNATPCLFVFDCLYFNGKSLLDCALKKRRELLQENMTEIPNRVNFSQIKIVQKLKDLESMLTDVLELGLEGLMLKDIMGVYEPGKRKWIKVKRDYLFEGKAADSVDLIVLGAWYGTGNKGGMMSIFLMGCYNPTDDTYRSVTKVHGHDDETLKALQALDVIKISRDFNKVPKWLKVTKSMVPDFVASDPKNMPIWEIAGHEFTKHDVHTADGISIRFPRVMKIRDDKTWDTATNLSELKDLYEKSKTNAASRILPFLQSDNGKVELKKGKQKKDETKKRKLTPDQPLADVLDGKKIKLNAASEAEFRRHFVAYGAEVVEDGETHKVVAGSFSVAKNNMGEKIMKIQLEAVK